MSHSPQNELFIRGQTNGQNSCATGDNSGGKTLQQNGYRQLLWQLYGKTRATFALDL